MRTRYNSTSWRVEKVQFFEKYESTLEILDKKIVDGSYLWTSNEEIQFMGTLSKYLDTDSTVDDDENVLRLSEFVLRNRLLHKDM